MEANGTCPGHRSHWAPKDKDISCQHGTTPTVTSTPCPQPDLGPICLACLVQEKCRQELSPTSEAGSSARDGVQQGWEPRGHMATWSLKPLGHSRNGLGLN